MTQSANLPSVSSDRRGVVGLLVLLFAITYIDRVCISVAGPRMQDDLGIDPIGWGWVTGVFTLAYGLFEIPTGMALGRTTAAATRPAITSAVEPDLPALVARGDRFIVSLRRWPSSLERQEW